MLLLCTNNGIIYIYTSTFSIVYFWKLHFKFQLLAWNLMGFLWIISICMHKVLPVVGDWWCSWYKCFFLCWFDCISYRNVYMFSTKVKKPWLEPYLIALFTKCLCLNTSWINHVKCYLTIENLWILKRI